MHTTEERLIELEIRHAHQERLVEELSSIVAEFGRRIANLERENRSVREMLSSLAPSTPESPDE
jgi:SlyX protein